MRRKWDKARVCMDHSRCIMCKSVCSPALQPLRESQWDDKSELRLDDAKKKLGQVFLSLPMRRKWDKARVCMDHSRCIMCKSVCSPALQPLRDSQWDDKSELRLDDAKQELGQVFLCLPMRWKWDKARVCMDHSRCIMCKSVCSPCTATTAGFSMRWQIWAQTWRCKKMLGQVVKLWFWRFGAYSTYFIKIACLVRTWQINYRASTTSFLLPLTYTVIISTWWILDLEKMWIWHQYKCCIPVQLAESYKHFSSFYPLIIAIDFFKISRYYRYPKTVSSWRISDFEKMLKWNPLHPSSPDTHWLQYFFKGSSLESWWAYMAPICC